MIHGTNHIAPNMLLHHYNLIDYKRKQNPRAFLGSVRTSRGLWDTSDSGSNLSGQQPADHSELIIDGVQFGVKRQ